ncbi:HEAT repeat domain-containing protein [Sphingobacterium sp. WM]|uniref:PVC-type heme-binding CxxCH protein n=1 Tax=Sphingobacterium sp. WM TaxID=3031802 RepID=UPI00240D60CE|nr:PVC-type heme-binding CxxCH protein [Sphingobacterium sp. WM]WFB63556.1 HEAT repeat domain-containing protein [Sphingobacterium sp. WM]
MKRYSWPIVVLFFILLASCKPKTQEFPFKPDSNSNIAIIGNSFALGLQRSNYFETLLYQSFPEEKLTIRNLGWDADEVNLRPRPLNFGTIQQHLKDLQANVIFACFGMNESFKGPDSLDVFKQDLKSLLESLQKQEIPNQNNPQIFLISPIAHEKINENLPDPSEHNKNLKIYSKGMAEVAKAMNIPFIDLFTPTKDKMDAGTEALTSDGIHLNEQGFKFVSEIMAKAMVLPKQSWEVNKENEELRKLVGIKNQHYFYRSKSQNGEYIYGRRREWAGGQELPNELQKIDHIVDQLDSLLWTSSKPGTSIDQSAVKKIIESGIVKPDPENIKPTTAADLEYAKSQFILPEGFEIELFASEKDFPLANPVSATFDAKGRMWVSTMPSYPNYSPGNPPNDKIIILEDTNADGIADKHSVFADSLYLPLGFELGDGGVYVTLAPDFVFLKDTNGDGRADKREVLLSGFGTEDSHHTLNTYTWGPDGALYMNMGTFLHTSVETPYGPRRGDYGNVWRYEPRTKKFDQHISYLFANPWGDVFMRDGTQLIADVSTGLNYFAPPLTVAIDYPKKHLEMKDFLTSASKPKTCGIEIISSRAFPDSLQGNVLFNTFIGFQGVKQHKLAEDGSGIIATEIQPLLQSKDPNFRPVDLKFGPDGALYVIDWYNPIIQHGEQNFRDPKRDHTKGRIWKISHKNIAKLPVVDMSKLSIAEILDKLRSPEDRERYRARKTLRDYSAEKIIPELNTWLGRLDKTDPEWDQNRLEGLWVYQQFNKPNKVLLEELLQSKSPAIRAAATRVLYYWADRIPNALDRLIKMSTDSEQRVRLEAVIALSHFKDPKAVKALLDVSDMPSDDYINYALNESFRHLRPVWVNMFKTDKKFLANEPKKAELLLNSVATKRESIYIGFVAEDPTAAKYSEPKLSIEEFNQMKGSAAVNRYLEQHKELLEEPQSNPEPKQEPAKEKEASSKATHIIKTLPGKMAYDKEILEVSAGENIILEFDNNDQMPHNIVFTKPGAQKKVGQAADNMSVEPDAYEKNFIPDIPEVLFASPLVQAGQSYQMQFVAPKEKGEYPFICTFPGHWQIMHGIMLVK